MVSEASVADLYSHFKRCCPSKDRTFQINTIRFIRAPKESPATCSPRKFPKSCYKKKKDHGTSPSRSSLNNFLPKDSTQNCLDKKTPRICFRTGSPEHSPRTASPKCSKSSLNNFFSEISPGPCMRKPLIYCPKESPTSSRESLKPCSPKDRCKRCSKPKKVTVKCGCDSDDKADKNECVEELYFNDEAKRSCGSSPR